MQVWHLRTAFFSTVIVAIFTFSSVSSATNKGQSISRMKGIPQIVFSDIDGTLVHYPEDVDSFDKGDELLLFLPPSSTGMRGIISHTTLKRCQEIRKAGAKLVLVSGMRTTTLIKRLPFLPKADAYCSEVGGRIFYPAEPSGSNVFEPEMFDGASEIDLLSYGLVEDHSWRQVLCSKQHIEDGAYAGNVPFLGMTDQPTASFRGGLLWSFAQQLEEKGYVLDTKGYSTCFRVNRKQQADAILFDELLEGKVATPNGLSRSTNLGCIDYYPVESGKRNCCQYLAAKFECDDLERDSVCLCDDDNDIEMAKACGHAYLPAVTSASLEQAISEDPNHFTKLEDSKIRGTRATDAALAMVLDLISSSRRRFPILIDSSFEKSNRQFAITSEQLHRSYSSDRYHRSTGLIPMCKSTKDYLSLFSRYHDEIHGMNRCCLAAKSS